MWFEYNNPDASEEDIQRFQQMQAENAEQDKPKNKLLNILANGTN